MLKSALTDSPFDRRKLSVSVPEDIDLPVWDLKVEDWNEGEKKEIIEDRGLGIVTKEVYYETKKTLIEAGETELKPWQDMESIGQDVSGVGFYTTTAVLPDDWKNENGAILKIENVNKHTLAVYVNGKKADAVDFDALEVDISDLLHTGENEIKVEVTTSLNNRLLARGYYEKGKEFSKMLAGNANNANVGMEEEDETGADMVPLFDIHAEVQDYGMVGNVRLVTYTAVEVNS